MEANHLPSDFKVNVKVDTTPGEDLIKVLEDMRQEYELIIKKKHQELDTWFREQVKKSDQTSSSSIATCHHTNASAYAWFTVSSHVPGGDQLGTCTGQPK